MRFDDTNPVKEDQEYVDGILDSVRWLGFTWEHGGEKTLFCKLLLRIHVSVCRAFGAHWLRLCR